MKNFYAPMYEIAVGCLFIDFMSLLRCWDWGFIATAEMYEA